MMQQTKQLEALGNAFVERQIERQIHEHLDRVRESRTLAREPENVVIFGEPGVGKTYIIESYLKDRRNQRLDENGNFRVDLLHIELESATDPVAISRDLAGQLGMPSLRAGSQRSDVGPLTQAVKAQMVAQGVEMIIIDEFHHIARDRGTITAERIARWVKSLSKKKERSRESPFGDRAANIPIVMVGTELVATLVKQDRELLSITPRFFEVARFGHQTGEQIRQWQTLLADLDDKLPFTEYSALGTPDIAYKIHQVTYGFLRQLGQLINEAG